MPQMSPMWWTTIMLTTILILIITMSINYFNTIKKINSEKLIKKNYMVSWKW